MNDEFYSSTRWKHKQKQILRRDRYQCQECKKYGRLKSAELVHHIVEIEENPQLALADSNLISICRSCHNKIHKDKGTRSNQSKRYNVNDPYGG